MPSCGPLAKLAFVTMGGLLAWLATFGGLAAIGADPLEPSAPAAQEAGTADLDRTSLPIPEPIPPPIATLDARNAKAPPRFEVKAPAAAPNVLVVLIDDMG